MDGKMVLASVLLAGLMVSSGFAVYYANQVDENNSDNGEEGGEIGDSAGGVHSSDDIHIGRE